MNRTATQRPNRSAIRVAIASLLITGTVAATSLAQAQTAAPTYESATARMQQASAGDAGAAEDAAEQFEKLLALQPADPVIRSYLGAATAMRARTTLLPWKKIRYAEDGLAHIDKALAMQSASPEATGARATPAHLEIRLVAATTFLQLPGFFNRADRGRRLLNEILAHPALDAAPAHFRAAVWLHAGALAEEDRQPDKARQFYERVAATDTAHAPTARARLKEL